MTKRVSGMGYGMSDRENLDDIEISKRFRNKIQYDNARRLWKWHDGRWIKAEGFVNRDNGRLEAIEWEANKVDE